MFAAAIITLAGIAFGIFVGEDRALGLQHRRGDDVLRRDQFKLVPLAIELRGDSLVHRWIRLAELAAKERRVDSLCGGWGPGHDCSSVDGTKGPHLDFRSNNRYPSTASRAGIKAPLFMTFATSSFDRWPPAYSRPQLPTRPKPAALPST